VEIFFNNNELSANIVGFFKQDTCRRGNTDCNKGVGIHTNPTSMATRTRA
jgi:hypothetical protein